MIARLYHKYRINKARKAGLQMSDDVRLEGTPDFGSEPYLISIGQHVLISGKVTFVTHDGGTWVFRDREPWKSRPKPIKCGRITIHDNCFIGYRVLIMPGVSIGPNSVVGSGSVVTKDVPPDTVVAGVPAKPIMSVEEYAEKSYATCAPCDQAEWDRDKKGVLLKLFPYPW